MSYEAKQIWISVLIFLASVGLFVLFAAMHCQAQWRGSGFECRFDVIGGCQIRTKDGKWIPAASYRELP
jgi:hypothetical protein